MRSKRLPLRQENTIADVIGNISVGDDCWEWLGNTDNEGYGRVGWHSKLLRAHRLVYELFEGPIESGLCVLHKCDNPGCVNPDHLFTGTNYDNIADRHSKGRSVGIPGGRHPNAKLQEPEVMEIRRLWATGRVMQKTLGRMFRVGPSNVGLIVHRKGWTHI